MAQLLITEEYFKANTPMGENVDMKVLTPDIEWIQDAFIIPLLGQDLFDLIITQSTPTTTLTPDNDILLNSHILKIMRLYCMAESIRSLKYKYTNAGIMVSTSANGTAISETEQESLIDKWVTRAETYGEKMINFIWDNPTKYPAYWTVAGVYRVRPRLTAYDSPFSFGNRGQQRFYYTEIDRRFDKRN